MAEKTRFIPFGPFVPDPPEFDTQTLDEAKNVVPIFNGYRPVRKRSDIATVTDSEPITGAFAHLNNVQDANQYGRPSADETVGDWVNYTSESDSLYEAVDEETASDEDYIFVGGAPTSEVAEISISSVTDPAGHSGHSYNWRYQAQDIAGTDAWSITCALMEGVTQIATDSVSSNSAMDNPVTRTASLSTAEAGSITNYGDLHFKITATAAGTAQFARPDGTEGDSPSDGWTDDGGATADLYAAIDESVASDADYVQSPRIAAGATISRDFWLSDVTDPKVDSSHVVRYRYQAEDATTDIDLTVYLIEDDGVTETTIASNTHETISDSWTAGTFTLSAAEADAITDYANLKLRFELTNQAAGAGTVQVDPSGDHTSSGTWNPGAPFWSKVDANDGNTVKNTSATSGDLFAVNLENPTDPESNSGHSATMRIKVTSGSGQARLDVIHSSSIIAKKTFNVSTSETAKTFTLTTAQAANITNYDNLRLRVVALTDDEFVVDQVYMTIPEPGKYARVSWAEMEVPSAAGMSVQHLEFVCPKPSSGSADVGDTLEIYAGNESTLYYVTSSAFTDYSKSGGYGTGTESVKSWDFCSWGNDVIATNYSDPVQKLASGGSQFADLITSSSKPKARFCAVIGNRLVLGNIDSSNGTNDMIWWSALDDAADFDVSATTGADYQELRSGIGGEITGMVGGDFHGLAFKRNSIYRIEDVGYPLIFKVYTLAAGDGTAYPRSIVADGSDVYYFGHGGFRRIRSMIYPPEPVGDHAVTKMLIDHEYETNAIKQHFVDDAAEMDATIIGAKDPFTGLIFWIYRDKSGTAHQNDFGVVYNPREDRWTRLEDTGLNIQALIPKTNVQDADTNIHKGLIGFAGDGTDLAYFKFASTTTYAATLKTEILSANGVSGGTTGNALMKAIRPVWRGDPGTADPNLTWTITAGEDPLMINNTRSATTNVMKRNRDGWYKIEGGIEGEYFTVQLDIPALTSKSVRTFIGFQAKGEERGRR